MKGSRMKRLILLTILSGPMVISAQTVEQALEKLGRYEKLSWPQMREQGAEISVTRLALVSKLSERQKDISPDLAKKALFALKRFDEFYSQKMQNRREAATKIQNVGHGFRPTAKKTVTGDSSARERILKSLFRPKMNVLKIRRKQK